MHVLDDFDFRHRNQTLIHHLVQIRNQLLYLVLRIDHADHNGRVRRERQKMRPMDERARTVPFDAAEYRGTSNVQLPALLDNGTVKRFVLPLIVLAEMNTQHFGITLKLHCRASFLLSSSW